MMRFVRRPSPPWGDQLLVVDLGPRDLVVHLPGNSFAFQHLFVFFGNQFLVVDFGPRDLFVHLPIGGEMGGALGRGRDSAILYYTILYYTIQILYYTIL